jgi:hypothetical protein
MTNTDPQQIAENVSMWENELTRANADHDPAEEALIALKLQCAAECAEAQAAVAEDPSEDNRFKEEAVHLSHGPQLAAAYARFGAVASAEFNLKRARYGLPPVGSNPASPGVNPLTLDVVAQGDVAQG